MYFRHRKTFEIVYVDNYGKETVTFTCSDGKHLVRSRKVFDKWFMKR